MTLGPYRGGGGGELRFVCLACYRHASIVGGLCPRCGIDLLPIDREDVRADLHAEAERRMQHRQYAEYFGVYLVAFMLMSPLWVLQGAFSPALYIFSSLGLGWAARKAYTTLRPRSALALYQNRTQRMQASLSGKGPAQLPPHESKNVVVGEGDPEEMSLEQTMRWLGLSTDDANRPPKK